MSDREIPDELKEMIAQIEERTKTVEQMRRLLTLAKGNPLAAASSDFLDLWDMRVTKQEQEIELVRMIQSAMKKFGDDQ